MNYLVDFTPESTQNDIDAYLIGNGLTVVKHFDKLNKVYLVSGEQLPPKTQIVEFVVENHVNGLKLLDSTQVIDNTPVATSTIDLAENKEWWKVASFNSVNFEAATQTFDVRDKKTTIYLLDSGVETSHPDTRWKS